MSAGRSEFVKTLEAGVFALSLMGLYFVQSTPLHPPTSPDLPAPAIKQSLVEIPTP